MLSDAAGIYFRLGYGRFTQRRKVVRFAKKTLLACWKRTSSVARSKEAASAGRCGWSDGCVENHRCGGESREAAGRKIRDEGHPGGTTRETRAEALQTVAEEARWVSSSSRDTVSS